MSKFSTKFAGYCVTVFVTLGVTPASAFGDAYTQVRTPLQLSIAPPLQLPNDKCTVYGLSVGLLRVGIHTKVAHEVLGLDGEDVIGLQIAGFDTYSRELYGAQVSGVFSSNSKSLIGLQLSGLGNFADSMPFGLQFALVANYLKHEMGFGAQLAAVCNESQSGTGLQAALGWNQCTSGAGLQLAIANIAIKEFSGIQFGLFNWGESKSGRIEAAHEFKEGHILSYGRPTSSHAGVGDMSGLQLGLANKSSALQGIQFAFVWNDAKESTGLQMGALNTTDNMTGLQFGLLNLCSKATVGTQVGIFNQAEHVTGVQFGLFNRTETMTGIQIGLLNIIKENPVLLLPLVNAHF
jgi:hypothetical protein